MLKTKVLTTQIELEPVKSEALEKEISEIRARQASEREKIKLWRNPIKTLWLFGLFCAQYGWDTLLTVRRHSGIALVVLGLIGALVWTYNMPGSHQSTVHDMETVFLRGAWWLCLGVLSSVGLGTGLHTFLLYLGPFIAKATLTATECSSVDFSRYGDDAFMCQVENSSSSLSQPSIMDILGLVQFEAFMWGLGTAIGELPPYFVARA